MTALELSERKVQFTDVWNNFFGMEPDSDRKIFLTPEEFHILLNKVKQGIEIIDEYLKEKG